MKDLLPDGEDLRRAIKWIAGNLQDNPYHPVMPLINEAVFKYDLSPRDADFLISFYSRSKNNLQTKDDVE